MEGTTAPILAGNILNESIPKDEADQLLQDLFHEMNEEGEEIRFAAFHPEQDKLSWISMLCEMYLRLLHLSKKHWIVVSSASAAPYTASPYEIFGSTIELKR